MPWLPEMRFQVFSAATRKEILDAWLDREWEIRAVDHGLCYRVKGETLPASQRKGAVHEEDGRRYGLWEITVSGAMVLESWPLGPVSASPGTA